MTNFNEPDYGTPASSFTEQVTLEIEGRKVTVPAGTSVLRAALKHGINIPKLCATDCLTAYGSCRLCLVEIEGRKGYPASCTTPCENGMKVKAHSENLSTLRKGVMELYMSDHPFECLTCPKNGHCELQDMAADVGLRQTRYGQEGKNHLGEAKDTSNPYFMFDPAKCIVCNRCVRVCEDIQGTFALTPDGRGFETRIFPGPEKVFLTSECVSCGACVKACPTAALTEKTLVTNGAPDKSTVTTCAYCGVGCSLRVEQKGNEILRLVPYNEGGANQGHACVKGRFAWGYVTHKDRVKSPMIRKKITDPWQEVSWEEAFDYAAAEFHRIQEKYGKKSVGGITSSRCTNEETYLTQKLVRAALGNNNTDTCARVCHAPTGYGLGKTFGTSAGTQDFSSVLHSDVIVVMGANPTAAHPVFGALLKRRVREGAKLIVIDPRRIEAVQSPHVKADYHLKLKPGTNVALLSAMAHVIVTENLLDEAFIAERCEAEAFAEWKEFVTLPENSPEMMAEVTGVPADQIRGAARLYATGGLASIYYGLGVTEHAQGSIAVIGIANLAMATGNIGKEGVGVNPLRGQNNVQGSCDMGSFPDTLTDYRPVSDPEVRAEFEKAWGVSLDPEPGYRLPDMFDAAVAGTYKALYCMGEDIVQSDPNTQHVIEAVKNMECVVVHDIFLNETAKYAHVFFPGSSFLEKDGTFTNSERRISRIRKVIPPLPGPADWQTIQAFSTALGYKMAYNHPSEIMDEIAGLSPSFKGVTYQKLEDAAGIQWPCDDEAEVGTPIMHVKEFTRGKGRFIVTQYMATVEKVTKDFPLILTTGRTLMQYNAGVQTRRTANNIWYAEDLLEIHPYDAEERRIRHDDWVNIKSRSGTTVLRAKVTENIHPGVVFTTFHFPQSAVNVITTENTDEETGCPEYKVTAVQITLAEHPPAWALEKNGA